MLSYFLNVEIVADDAFLNEMLNVITAYELSSLNFGQCIQLIEINESHVLHDHFI